MSLVRLLLLPVLEAAILSFRNCLYGDDVMMAADSALHVRGCTVFNFGCGDNPARTACASVSPGCTTGNAGKVTS